MTSSEQLLIVSKIMNLCGPLFKVKSLFVHYIMLQKMLVLYSFLNSCPKMCFETSITLSDQKSSITLLIKVRNILLSGEISGRT